MIARHAHREGQPRRSWAPLDPDFPRTLPTFEPDAHPYPKAVPELLDQMDGDLFRAVRQGPLPGGAAWRTLTATLEFLAPRRTPARTVARVVRKVVGYGMFEVCVLAVSTVPPVLYAVGV